MKKVVLFLTLAGFLISCNNNDDNNTNNEDSELIGTWRLIENLADPGGGSGVFVSVESDKEITFNADGTITSNGTLCNFSIASDVPSSGTYSLDESTINSDSCTNNANFEIEFTLEDSILIINYPCIEPCRSKFIKLE